MLVHVHAWWSDGAVTDRIMRWLYFVEDLTILNYPASAKQTSEWDLQLCDSLGYILSVEQYIKKYVKSFPTYVADRAGYD